MARILPETFRLAFSTLLDALLQPSCLLCLADAADVLCPACAADLPRLSPGCPRCAEPTTHGERCGRCLAAPPHFDAAVAPFQYAFPADRLIHAFKYGGELSLARWFGEAIAEGCREPSFDLVVPMPLHPERLSQRGFNQAVELARHIGSRLRVPLAVAACSRRRATSPQAELPHKERAANVCGAFECSQDLSGKSLLLVDDVMTTGATLDECARTLKLHGASRVTVAIATRALR